MYENMAEFCLLGCSRHTGTDDKKAQQAQQARQAWEVVKSAKRQPAPRYTGSTPCTQEQVRQDAWRVTSRRMLKPARTPRRNRHTGSASNRQAAYSFSQKQAVDRHTNAKTPEPELEPECGQA